jgi:hypothetical protein
MVMNTAWFAKTASDELTETLFFGGFDYSREKSVVRGNKTYTFKTKEFTLTISGRNISIGEKKFKHIAEAKRHIQLEYVR